MPERVDTNLTSWKFTEEEEQVAYIFPDLQYKHLQNELSIAVYQRATLPVDPLNINKYLMEVEYMRGKIEMLEYLLMVHGEMLAGLTSRVEQETRRRQFEQRSKPQNAAAPLQQNTQN